MRIVLLFFLLVNTIVCYAVVYMQTDKNNEVIYSDTPLGNSQQVILPSPNSISSAFQTTPSQNVANEQESNPLKDENTNKQYTVFSITSPKDQETIHNQPVIPVEVLLVPKLQKGDKIQLLLDGQLSGSPAASTHLELGQVERGIHQLYAVIINAAQQVTQRSKTINIFIHRANLNSNPAFAPPPPPPPPR